MKAHAHRLMEVLFGAFSPDPGFEDVRLTDEEVAGDLLRRAETGSSTS